MTFVDTSAFLAILSIDDHHHSHAELCLRGLREENQTLSANNYVIIESIALIQKRLGIDKVRDFQNKILPLIQIEWVDEEQHKIAIDRVLSANRRKLSLVDCSAFETMRRLGIDTAFTFDSHFREEGFAVIPKVS
ncbi:MAG: type II toxin-antitoxin system VapC family toxin [Anaerolineales bacterium]|nr:type II toxin-antitoxin system VapC family toxin [Anaerolineales bacterium]